MSLNQQVAHWYWYYFHIATACKRNYGCWDVHPTSGCKPQRLLNVTSFAVFGSNGVILTHLAYIANGKKTCYIVQQFHWANKRDVTLRHL